ncbi:LamG domain-containing protein [Candidatus Shapirobacteria bacterium]|nr:LamG domain-containing protein [Candidatus Shapirobacteria bacterium]
MIRKILILILVCGLFFDRVGLVLANEPQLLPTFEIINSQNFRDGSAKKREKISLKSKIKATYGSKEKVQVSIYNIDQNLVEVKLKNSLGETQEIESVQEAVDSTTAITVIPPPQFRPGRYSLEIRDQLGEVVSQDFLWGVLAMNLDKDKYGVGEVAKIDMAVLDELGKMVCDANVKLLITNDKLLIKEEFSTENKKIIVNPNCSKKDFTLKPDYETSYKFDKTGTYNLELTATTANGTYSISQEIIVKSGGDFNVKRVSATRIYPANIYPMNIEIEAKRDFKGKVYETVPVDFEIKDTIGRVVEENGIKKIVWDLDIKSGERRTLVYKYKAPEISPQFYLTGPLSMATLTDLIYQEARQWQIAVDDTGNVTIRQEINIIDGPVTVGGTDAALINIDTTKYTGATYYFEVVASQGAGTTLTVNLSAGNTQSVSIGITDTSTLIRSRKVFTPVSGSFDYRLNVVTGTTHSIKAARVIILQNATEITATETQIEIGNEEIGLTMATGVKQPVMQAIGVSAAATTGTASPAWPTHQTDDVALLFVETIGESAAVLTTPNGFVAVTASPKAVGTGTSGTTLSVFWARATSGAMSAPVIKASGDHIFAVVVTYRNVIETGDPWDVAIGSTKAVVSTRTTWESVTTTVDNTLIVYAATRHNDSAAAAWGIITNPGVTGLTERVDSGTTSGNGGGLKISDGIFYEAGVGGTSTATVTSSINATMTIALKGGDNPAATPLNSPKYWKYDSNLWGGTQTVSAEATWMKNDTGTYVPRFQAIGGAVSATTGTASPAWPTHQANDIAILYVETIGNTTVSLTTPNGFTAMTNSPQATGVGGTNTALTVYWARATSSSMTAPVIKGSGNHIYAVIATYRNAVETGDPWDVTVGSTKPANSTLTTWNSLTTNFDNELVVFVASRGNDSAAAAWGVITNSNMIGVNERWDAGTTSGDGGGLKISDGVLETAGVGGTSTATMSVSTQNAVFSFALRGKVKTSTKLTITVQEDDGSFGNWVDVSTILDLGTSSGQVIRSRSPPFVPTTGRNYRLAKTLNNSNGHSIDIYNAKIIIDQTSASSIGKLEAQYLVLNTKSTTTGSALGYKQLWSSAEWLRTTNVYKYAQDAIGAGANSKLRDTTASSDLTNSSVTGENQTISSGVTMPTTGNEIDSWLVNAGTEVDAGRILVQVTVNAITIDPTAYSFQRKTWFDGTRYWRSYYDNANSRVNFEYSSDGFGWTENTSARLTIANSDFSIEADSARAFIVYSCSSDVCGRVASSYPGTGFGWGAEQTVFNGTGATDDYSYPVISRDSSSYVWVVARYTGSGVYYVKTIKETSATNDLPEDSGDNVDSLVNVNNSNSNVYGTIVPRGSQDMYITMAIGATIAGCKWVNSSTQWQNSGGASCEDYPTLASGLVGYWQLEEAGDATRADSSGYGNDLTESASDTIAQVAGKFGNGADFERADTEYLSIGAQSEFNLSSFTMSAWLKVESIAGNYESVMGYSDSGDWSYNMAVGDVNEVMTNVDNDGFAGGGAEIYTANNSVATATWALFTTTFDGTDLRMYKNGVEVSSGFPATLGILPNYSTGNFYLGYWSSQSEYYDGIMDDVRLYNRALGATEVSLLYNYNPSGGSYDAIGTGQTGITTTLSSVADASGNVHLAFVDVGGSMVYREYTSSWQTAVVLDTNAGNAYPSVTLNTTNSDVYVFWIRGNHIYYKKGASTYTSGSWDASATDWKTTGTNTLLTSNFSGADIIFAEWYDGTNISWDKINFGGVVGPVMQQLLRHGMWFSSGARQKFTF